MPRVERNRVWRGNIGDTTSKIESKLQFALDQVQTNEITTSVVQLAIVK